MEYKEEEISPAGVSVRKHIKKKKKMYTPAINNESKCSIYEKDGYVTIVEELDTTDKSAIVISWKAILFIICLFIGIKTISANVFDSKKQETTQSTSIQTTGETVSVSKTEYAAVPDSNSYEDPLDKELASFFGNGIIFPDSSSRILSAEEIAPLDYWPSNAKDRLYQYAINEIFARNGYSFNDPDWANYYSRYSWYQNRGYSDEDARDRFNETERKNMKMLEKKRKETRGY